MKLIIPKIKPSGVKIIQDAFCRDAASDCSGVACKDCMFSEDNIKHFIRYMELESIHGDINVA